jgi:uncharacterized protein YdaU (DUF1376 family)
MSSVVIICPLSPDISQIQPRDVRGPDCYPGAVQPVIRKSHKTLNPCVVLQVAASAISEQSRQPLPVDGSTSRVSVGNGCQHGMQLDHPYMPLYFGDVLRRTLYWSGEERALLLLLSAAQWCSGPLPLEISKLANALQYNEETFIRLWEARVHTLFTATPAGFVDEELEARRENVARLSGARRAAGQASGKARRARTEQQDDSMLEQPTEQPVRTKVRTSSAALVRTPIQSNPSQSNPDQVPPRSGSTPAEDHNQTASSPSEPDIPPARLSARRRAAQGATRCRRIPADHPLEQLREWASEHTPGVNFDSEIALLRDHEFRDPHSDWDAVARNWLRRAGKQTTRGADDQHLTRFERHKRRLFGA